MGRSPASIRTRPQPWLPTTKRIYQWLPNWLVYRYAHAERDINNASPWRLCWPRWSHTVTRIGRPSPTGSARGSSSTMQGSVCNNGRKECRLRLRSLFTHGGCIWRSNYELASVPCLPRIRSLTPARTCKQHDSSLRLSSYSSCWEAAPPPRKLLKPSLMQRLPRTRSRIRTRTR